MTATPETACQRLARLEAERERIVLGEKETEIFRAEANGVQDRARYGQADLTALNGLIAEARRACDREQGRPTRRRLIHLRSN